MKTLHALLIVLLVSATGTHAAAQELPTPPGGSSDFDAPPQLELPSLPGVSTETKPADNASADQYENIESGSAEPYALEDEYSYEIMACEPSLLESSGTWLRRGFWYSEVDAVLFNRSFDDNTITYLTQPLVQDQTPFGFPVLRRNDLFIGGEKPGVEGAPRVKLGRFLFRDAINRDHNAEFIAYGGGQWSQTGQLNAVNDGNPGTIDVLQVPTSISRGNPDFSGATSGTIDYDSRFNSFELNYHVKQRMHRDRMELDPAGHWVRRAQPTSVWSLIAGIRYFDTTENFLLTASGFADNDNDGDPDVGNYLVRTDNDMIGTQLGFTRMYQTARWSAGVEAKGGAYLNLMNLESSFNVPNAGTTGNTDINEDNLSFVGEVALRGRWHMKPNASIRVGLELLYVNSVALAPFQVNFVPGTNQVPIVSSGDNVYLGASIGWEGYW